MAVNTNFKFNPYAGSYIPKQHRNSVVDASRENASAAKVQAAVSSLALPATQGKPRHLIVPPPPSFTKSTPKVAEPKTPKPEKRFERHLEIKTEKFERIAGAKERQSSLQIVVDLSGDERTPVSSPRPERSRIQVISRTSTPEKSKKIAVVSSAEGSPQNIKITSTFKEVVGKDQNTTSFRQHKTVLTVETSSDGQENEVTVVQEDSSDSVADSWEDQYVSSDESPKEEEWTVVAKPKKTKAPVSLADRYEIQINPRPPEPKNKKYDIDKRIADLWVKYHVGPEKEVLGKIVDNIKALSFESFLTGLEDSADRFVAKIKNAEYFALVEPEKSNLWVAELANAKGYLKGAPPKGFLRLGEAHASSFVAFMEEAAAKGEWNSIPKNVVLFDDGSYSGNQLANHITAIYNKVSEISAKKRKKVEMNVHVVVPCMTQVAYEVVLRAFKKFKRPKNLYTSIRFKCLRDILDKREIEVLTGFWDFLYAKNKNMDSARSISCLSVRYFQHKIPNTMSFIPVLNGSISSKQAPVGKFKYISPIKPPYKS